MHLVNEAFLEAVQVSLKHVDVVLQLFGLLAHALLDLKLGGELLLGLHLEVFDEEDILVLFGPLSPLLHVDHGHVLVNEASLFAIGGSLVLLVDLVELGGDDGDEQVEHDHHAEHRGKEEQYVQISGRHLAEVIQCKLAQRYEVRRKDSLDRIVVLEVALAFIVGSGNHLGCISKGHDDNEVDEEEGRHASDNLHNCSHQEAGRLKDS